jgi:hypothetical protein
MFYVDKARLRRLLALLAVYGVLAFPWPGLGRAFCTGYAWAAEAVLADVLPSGMTTFRAGAPGEALDEWNVLVQLPAAAGSTLVHGVRVHVRRICYVPLAFLLALAVAYPVERARRWVTAAGCLVALAGAQIVALLSAFTARGLLDLGLLPNVVITVSSRVLLAPAMSFAVPGVAWIVLVAYASSRRTLAEKKLTMDESVQGSIRETLG